MLWYEIKISSKQTSTSIKTTSKKQIKFIAVHTFLFLLCSAVKLICLPFPLRLQSKWPVQREVRSPEPQPFVHMSALLSHTCSQDTTGSVTLQERIPWAACHSRFKSYGDSNWLIGLRFLTQSSVPMLTNSAQSDRTWLFKRPLSPSRSLLPSVPLPLSCIPVVSCSCLCNCCNNWSPLPPSLSSVPEYPRGPRMHPNAVWIS